MELTAQWLVEVVYQLLDPNPSWPELRLGWRMVLATFLVVVGASLGSVGGLGGGGIFVPVLVLLVGFDAKTAPAVSKCMIMAQTISTVTYNVRLKRTATGRPLVDYDLAMLFQPMLILGISIGVLFNIMFPDWFITLLLIVLSTATAARACWRGLETWKQETLAMNMADDTTDEDKDDAAGAGDKIQFDMVETAESVWSNVRWKEVFVLIFIWCAVLLLQLLKTKARECSREFWIYSGLQIPVTLGSTLFQSIRLRRRSNLQESLNEPLLKPRKNWSISTLLLYSLSGVLGGVVGGLLGLGGGAIVGPVLLEFGIPPQAASATAIFIMMFSSSMSVVEYYLLDRFPVPHALYFGVICIAAAYAGQYVLQKAIALFKRTSIIVFALVFVVIVGGVSLGGDGVIRAIHKYKRGEFMGFQSPCLR